MNDLTYITPTKKHLVFTAVCDHFGYIELPMWKQWAIRNPTDGSTSVGSTFATDYNYAIQRLHTWIVEHSSVLDSYPKAKFQIRALNGDWDHKNDHVKESNVYTISAKKAKQYLFN